MAEGKDASAGELFEQLVSQDNKDVRYMVIEIEDGAPVVIAQGNSFKGFPGAFDASKVQWGAFCCHGIDRRGNVEVKDVELLSCEAMVRLT